MSTARGGALPGGVGPVPSTDAGVSHRKKLAGHICHAKTNTQKNLRCIPEAACYGATDDKFFCVYICALQICPASFFLWDTGKEVALWQT